MTTDRTLDIIEVCDYDPGWPERFRAERGRIKEALGGVAKDIQHVGSTAVPGLAAKPIIDIMVAVEDLSDMQKYFPGMASLGYTNIPHDEDAERRFFLKGMPRTHHVHVVTYGRWTYWKHLLFRDYLMDHPITLEEYECLKRILAKRFRDDREKYLEGKSDFIVSVMDRAVREKVIFYVPVMRSRP